MKFERLTVLREAETRTSTGKIKYVCLCDCGNTCEPWAQSLTSNLTRSCGCLVADKSRESNRTHGKKGSKIYRIWSGMLDRCRNPNSKDYERYGGRGIVVCQEWYTFENFYRDMGEPPHRSASIDRVDTNGPYDLYNCVWSTPTQQSRNRRNNTLLTLGERTATISEWCEILGVQKSLISGRLRLGWSAERALTEPIDLRFRRSQ